VYRGIVTGSIRKYGNFSCRLGHSAFETANRLSIKMEITPVTGTYRISCRHQSFDATTTSARATELQQSETRFARDFSSRVCMGIDINLWRLDKRLAPVAQPVAHARLITYIYPFVAQRRVVSDTFPRRKISLFTGYRDAG